MPIRMKRRQQEICEAFCTCMKRELPVAFSCFKISHHKLSYRHYNSYGIVTLYPYRTITLQKSPNCRRCLLFVSFRVMISVFVYIMQNIRLCRPWHEVAGSSKKQTRKAKIAGERRAF